MKAFVLIITLLSISSCGIIGGGAGDGAGMNQQQSQAVSDYDFLIRQNEFIEKENQILIQSYEKDYSCKDSIDPNTGNPHLPCWEFPLNNYTDADGLVGSLFQFNYRNNQNIVSIITFVYLDSLSGIRKIKFK